MDVSKRLRCRQSFFARRWRQPDTKLVDRTVKRLYLWRDIETLSGSRVSKLFLPRRAQVSDAGTVCALCLSVSCFWWCFPFLPLLGCGTDSRASLGLESLGTRAHCPRDASANAVLSTEQDTPAQKHTAPKKKNSASQEEILAFVAPTAPTCVRAPPNPIALPRYFSSGQCWPSACVAHCPSP
jgi:hypothetical protein